MTLKEFDKSNSTFSDLADGDEAFLAFFENYLSDILHALDLPIRDLARRVLLEGGKRIRPLLVYRCGCDSPDVTEDLLKISAILELVHVATLVHDDILDQAEIRRSQPTIHTEIGEHAAILLGDALFSFALELATEFPTTRICNIVSSATRRTCSGEIMQTFSRGNYDISLSDYFSFIQNKTGELFKASCQAGAFLAGHSEDILDVVGEFGLSLGLNYQIFDDLLDSFGKMDNAGKSLGTDFDSGKITLPLLFLFQKLSREDATGLRCEMSSGHIDEALKERIGELFISHGIKDECLLFLSSKLSETKLIASNISFSGMSDRLLTFLSSFDEKLSVLSPDSIPNFLAFNK